MAPKVAFITAGHLAAGAGSGGGCNPERKQSGLPAGCRRCACCQPASSDRRAMAYPCRRVQTADQRYRLLKRTGQRRRRRRAPETSMARASLSRDRGPPQASSRASTFMLSHSQGATDTKTQQAAKIATLAAHNEATRLDVPVEEERDRKHRLKATRGRNSRSTPRASPSGFSRHPEWNHARCPTRPRKSRDQQGCRLWRERTAEATRTRISRTGLAPAGTRIRRSRRPLRRSMAPTRRWERLLSGALAPNEADAMKTASRTRLRKRNA